MMDRKKKTLLSPLLERTLKALERQRSIRTLENYHSSINKVKDFVGDGWERLTMEDITRCWTDRFTAWLESRHGDKPQTADFYLRTFRAVYTHALALSSEGTDGKPFSGHHTGGIFPAKRALRREEVQRLLSPDLWQTLPENQREALDVLLFIFYARGMVFKDVYGLTHRMVTDRHIRYLRSKTGVPIDVEVVPELEEIMKRYYREDSPFVFPFLHETRKRLSRKRLLEETDLYEERKGCSEERLSKKSTLNEAWKGCPKKELLEGGALHETQKERSEKKLPDKFAFSEIREKCREKESSEMSILHETRNICFGKRLSKKSAIHEARKGCPGKELSEESALRRINRATREIGRKTGLSVPLTTYVLRHTWATLMLEDSQPVELISQCMGHSSIRTTQIYLSRISSHKVDAAVSGMYDRMLRLPGHKRKERDILSGHHRKPDSLVSQPMENRNAQPYIPLTSGNKKYPFLAKKETFVSCHVNTVIFFATKVYISYVCCKFSSAFFSVLPDISSCLPFLYSFHAM